MSNLLYLIILIRRNITSIVSVIIILVFFHFLYDLSTGLNRLDTKLKNQQEAISKLETDLYAKVFDKVKLEKEDGEATPSALFPSSLLKGTQGPPGPPGPQGPRGEKGDKGNPGTPEGKWATYCQSALGPVREKPAYGCDTSNADKSYREEEVILFVKE